MDSHTITLIAVLGVLILMSAYFSSTETAFSSLNKIRLKNMANNGNRKAAKTLKLEEQYDKLLSTILIGNNIVNIASASIATVIFTKYWGDLGITMSTIVMTILVLIFGEITPKSLAKEMPENFAMFATPSIHVMMILLTPINWLFSMWKKGLSKLFKFQNDSSMTQEELMTIVEEAQNDGDLAEHEGNLICAAIEFNDLDVKDILTPRVDVIAVDVKFSLEQVESLFRLNRFSRFPVYENTIDNIVGVIHEKDFYNLYYTRNGSLKTITKTILYTSPHVKISTLLRQLQSSKTHMAVVVDEYGGTAGIITLEDILEELVGDIWDEHDEVKEYYTKVDDATYLVECEADLDDMFEIFAIEPKEDYDFITVSGWVIHELERIPKAGDSFSFENLFVTVTKTDARKVIEVKVQILPKEEEEDEEDSKKNRKEKNGFIKLPLF